MNQLFRFSLYAASFLLMLPVFVSCNEDSVADADEAKEKTLSAVVEQYVNYTVIATYKALADESVDLYNALAALKENKTNANVQAAAQKWIKARDYWELSEAFLFGAASDFGIDPHIDTWPLAKDELVSELANNAHIAGMSGESGDEWVAGYLGFGLLGFHGIEYILFEDGQPKDAGKITDSELIYAVAVAGDLRNQCFRLEASWAGLDKVSDEKREKLELLEMSVTVNGGNSYGQNMLNAGKAGSTKTSFVDACETIIEGCITIADEVGAVKIGRPHTGEDVNYIESPYSYNSKVDFIGNIKSIQNAYLGGMDATKRGASLGDFIKTVDSELDKQIREAMNNAIAKIEAIPYPFAKHFTSAQAGEAMEACNDLADILGEAKKALNK
ncbi:MAG: peptidase M75 [Dysgonamonadaceae bacterium]|jgi:hypothetical protein|nr:peptidase M75 [Dysgonamonadaceae bacterium]